MGRCPIVSRARREEEGSPPSGGQTRDAGEEGAHLKPAADEDGIWVAHLDPARAEDDLRIASPTTETEHTQRSTRIQSMA